MATDSNGVPTTCGKCLSFATSDHCVQHDMCCDLPDGHGDAHISFGNDDNGESFVVIWGYDGCDAWKKVEAV